MDPLSLAVTVGAVIGAGISIISSVLEIRLRNRDKNLRNEFKNNKSATIIVRDEMGKIVSETNVHDSAEIEKLKEVLNKKP